MPRAIDDLGDFKELESLTKSGNKIKSNIYLENIVKHYLEKSSPSDSIHLTRDDDWRLMTLWETEEKATIPSDLIFSKNIPLMDFVVHIDEREYGGVESSARFCIFDYYTNFVDNPPHTGNAFAELPFPVGCMVLYLSKPVIIPIVVQHGVDSLLDSQYVFFKDADGQCPNVTKEFLSAMAFAWLETWYSIQIAMLHPQVKECFKTKGKEKIRHTSKIGKKRNRVTKYIKKKYLNETDFAEDIGNHKFVRKCLAWYVCGHWRHYKTGKTKFIQGYWKGVLRETKRNHDDGRERLINNVGEYS